MRRFLGSAFFLMVADVAQKGTTAILALILARFLGPAEFGTFATATAIAALFLMITNGFELEMVRRSTSAPLGQSLSLTMVSAGLMIVVAALALCLQQWLLPNRMAPAMLTFLAAGGYAVFRFSLPFRYVSVILGETHVSAIIQSVATVALLGGTLAVMAFKPTVEAALVVQVAAGFFTFSIWEVWRRRRGLRYAPVTTGMTRTFFRHAVSFMFANLLWAVYFNVDVVLMSWLRGTEDVGIYSAMFRLTAMTFLAGSALTGACAPALFAAASDSAAHHRRLAWGMMRSLLGVGAAVGAVLALGAVPLTVVAMGSPYLAGVPALRVLALAAFLRIVNFGLTETLTTGGRQSWRVSLEGGLVVANIGLNLLWIPRLGLMGAAWAAVASELVMTVAGLLLWRAMDAAAMRAAREN